MHESEKWKGSRSVVSYSSWPHGLQPTRLLRPWDFPGKSTGVGCHCLLHSSLYFLINNNLTIISALSDWAPTLWQTRYWKLYKHYPICGWFISQIPWRRKWQPTPVLLPGEFHNRGACQATVDGGHKKSNTTELLSLIYPKLGSKFLLVRDLIIIYCTILSSTEKGS